MTTSASLAGYAVLHANFNEGRRDYLENFLEFALDALEAGPTKGMSVEDICAYIHQKYGILIPVLAGKNLLQIGKRKKYLMRNDELYRLNPQTTKKSSSVSLQFDRFIREQNELSRALVKFSSENLPFSSDEPINKEEAARLIAVYMEQNSIPLLKRAMQGVELPELSQSENYLVSSFVNWAQQNSNQFFNSLVEVAKGATLAAVLTLELPELNRNLRSLRFYLDAPVVLDFLGCHGALNQAATQDFVMLAQSLGVKVQIFEHTIREVTSILVAAQSVIQSGVEVYDSFKVASHFANEGYTAADVEIVIGKLEADLAKSSIIISPKPNKYVDFGLDEAALEAAINDALPGQNRQALLFDVDSISAVHQLRGSRRGDKFETSEVVLISSNAELVSVTNKEREGRGEFPLALLDSTAASMLWVRKPSVSSTLPSKKVAATAWAGMQPPAHIWASILRSADSLAANGKLSESDVAVLKYSHVSKTAYMNEVYNSGGQPTLDPREIARKATLLAQAPIQAELERVKKLAEDSKNLLTIELDGEQRKRRIETDDLRNALKSIQIKNDQRLVDQRAILRRKAESKARLMVRGILWACFVVCLTATLYSLIGAEDLTSSWTWLAPVFGFVSFVVLLAGLVTLFFGGSVLDVSARFRVPLADYYYNKSLKLLGLTLLEPEPIDLLPVENANVANQLN